MSDLATPGSVPASRPRTWSLLLLGVCAIAPQLGSLSYGFVDYDDQVAIVELPLIRSLRLASLPNFFRFEIYPWLPEYMPLKNLSYALDYACFGLWAPGYRVQQLFWYTASVLLFFSWLRALLVRLREVGRLGLPGAWAEPSALLVAALFALHPVHVESVTWISGRKDLLSGAFMFAALCCAFAYRPGAGARGLSCLLGSYACCALSLLSKPSAVVLPLLVVFADCVCAPSNSRFAHLLRARGALYAGLSLLALGFALLYVSIVHDYADIDRQFAADLYAGPGYLRWGQQLKHFLSLCLAPNLLVPRFPSQLLDPRPGSVATLLSLLLLVSMIAGGVWLLVRRHPLALALGLFAIPLMPVLIAPAWGQYVAGRYLFQAVGGVMLALVWLGAAALVLRPHLRWAAWAACGLLALRFAVGTLDYSRNWRDSVSLWTGAIAVYPQVTENYEHAGVAALRQKQPELALTIFRACLTVDEAEAACNTGLAALLVPSQPAEAERLLRRALPGDRDGSAHVALALLMANSGKAPAALGFYEAWLNGRAVTPDQLNAYAHVAVLAEQPRKAWRAAVQAAQLRATRFPAAPPAREALLEVAQAQGDPRFLEHVNAVLARCQRSDCVTSALAQR